MPHRTQSIELMSGNAMFMNLLFFPLVIFINTYAEQLLILIVFMTFDFLSGLAKARILKKQFTFERFYSGVITKFFIFCIPFMIHFFSRGVNQYDDQIASIIPWGLSALIAAELYSSLGNVYTIITKEELKDKSMIGYVILLIRKFIEAFIKAFRA